MTRKAHLVRGIVAPLLAFGLVAAACGSDDADDSSTDPTAAAIDTTDPVSTEPASTESVPAPTEVVEIRFGSIESSGQSIVPIVMEESGIAERYGLDVEIVPFAQPGAQYTLVAGGEVDLVPGNILDLHRQRGAGSDLVGVWGFQRFTSPIVTLPDSPIETFEDLRGSKVGQFGTTFLDWLVIRTAGSIAYDLDLEVDAELVQATPPLLNQALSSGEVDATLQFDSLALAPLTKGQQRAVTDVPTLLEAADLDPDSLYLVWMMPQSWIDEHPEAFANLQLALAETYEVLMTDDSVWPPLVELVGITEPDVMEAYIASERAKDNPPFNAALFEPTQALIDAMVATVGADVVGLEALDPAAFVFPSAS